jgi:hypothetical protein
MIKNIFCLSLLFVLVLMTDRSVSAQGGYVFGFMGGPTLSTQKMRGFQREPFLRYHGLAFIESVSEYSPNSLYARLGYHVKGSAINTTRYFDLDGNEYPRRSSSMEFHNLSFSLGVKQRRELGNLYYHYAFGVRGDYNLKGKFGDLFKGLEGAQNKFTYGVNVDAGIEFPLSELVSAVIEIGISPDLGEQLFIPPQNTGYTYSDGRPIILPETSLTNVVFELRAGFRFWRKIVYID